jgi:hypothetical protein
LFRGVNASLIPFLKLYLIVPKGRSRLGELKIAFEQAYRGGMPRLMARAQWGGEDGLVMGESGLERNDSCEMGWMGAKVFCERDIIDVGGP